MIFKKDSFQYHERLSTGKSSGSLVWILALVLFASVFAPVSAHSQRRPFRLEGLQGGQLGPADFDQGVIIVVVWASWSPHCRNIVEQVDAIADRWGSQSKVIMVDFQEEKPDVESFLSGKRPKSPVYLDKSGAFSKEHSVTNLPGLVIFKDGTAAFSGKLSRNPDSIISQTLG